jgi:hypothetical protein|nr:MAG TPA: hypothetical protein [Caudoviricetes sp.]
MLIISSRLKPYPYERMENDGVSSDASPYVKLNQKTVYLGLLHYMPYDQNGNDLLEAGNAEESKDQRFSTTKNALTASRISISLKSEDWRKSRTNSVNGQEVYEYKKEIPLQLLHKTGDNDWKYIVGVALYQFPDDEEAFKHEQRLKAKRDEAKQTAMLLKVWTNEEERNYKAYEESLQKPFFLVAKDFKRPIPTSQCLLSGKACIVKGGLKLEKALLMALGWQPETFDDVKKAANKGKAALEKAKKLFKEPANPKVISVEQPKAKKKKKKADSIYNAQPAFKASEVQFGEAVDTDSIFEGQQLTQERTLDDAMGLETGFINPFGLIKQQDEEESQM